VPPFLNKVSSALKDKWRLTVACGAVALTLDLVTKAAVLRYLNSWESLTVVDGFFNLVLAYNTGAAFSLLAGDSGLGQSLKMTALSVLALLPFIYFFIQAAPGDRSRLASVGLIWGGALGNIHDRLRWGAVVDFLDFHWRGYHWPAFNFADIAICLGAGLLGLSIWREKPVAPEGRA
jgi:signal peptidase II